MGPHGAYRGGPLFIHTSGYCAALADPPSACEITGSPIPRCRPLYTTGFTGSPVKEHLPNMPVKCNLVGATTQRCNTLAQHPGQGDRIICQCQCFDLVTQLRIAEVEVEYKIPQGICIDISQFFFECIDVHRTKWKFIKSFRLVQTKSLAPERRESFPHQTGLSRFNRRQLITGLSATTR